MIFGALRLCFFGCLLASVHSLENFLERFAAVSGDLYVYVGGTLELNCTLDLNDLWENESPENITFELSHPTDYTDPPDECLPASRVHAVPGSRIATLIVPNVTVNDSGNYRCYVGDGPCPKENYVGATASDVFIEYAPQEVVDVIWYIIDFNEGMDVYWTHPVDYVNWANIATSVTVLDKLGNQASYLSSTRTSWIWTQYGGADTYYFGIEVTNLQTGDSVSTIPYIINTSESVKPLPVQGLTLEPVDGLPDCVRLTWAHDKLAWGLIFRVMHKSPSDVDFKVLAENIKDIEYESCGYGPMTNQTFSVDCYPDGLYSGYWSEPEIDYIVTPQTDLIPTAPPDLLITTSPPDPFIPTSPPDPLSKVGEETAILFKEPFLRWLNSSTELNVAHVRLAQEQVEVAKLTKKKLNMELRQMKKATGGKRQPKSSKRKPAEAKERPEGIRKKQEEVQAPPKKTAEATKPPKGVRKKSRNVKIKPRTKTATKLD